jgi:hypothetical protein
MLLGNFSANLGTEDIFKPTMGNENLHEISNDNAVRVPQFATSKNLIINTTLFSLSNINKYIWTSPDGKTHSQADYVSIDIKTVLCSSFPIF